MPHCPSSENTRGGRQCYCSSSKYCHKGEGDFSPPDAEVAVFIYCAYISPDGPSLQVSVVSDGKMHVTLSSFAPPIIFLPLFTLTCPHRQCWLASAGFKIALRRWLRVGWDCFGFEIRIAFFLCNWFHFYHTKCCNKVLKLEGKSDKKLSLPQKKLMSSRVSFQGRRTLYRLLKLSDKRKYNL